jgi:hypothetical protein
MRAVLMVVANILREQSLEMAFHRDNVVQQVSSAAFDPTLRYAILPRAFKGRSYWAHLHGSNDRRNLQPVLGIAVEDEKLSRQIKRKRFSQLLNDPEAKSDAW